MTINLVQGDLTPIIIITPTGADLTGKQLKFEMYRAGRTAITSLDAVLVGGEVVVGLTEQATAVPGLYLGQLVVVGEQTSFEQVQINIRSRTS